MAYSPSSSTFPTAKTTFIDPSSASDTDDFDHAGLENTQNDGIEKLETAVGITGSADTDSLNYKLTNASQTNPGHVHTASAVSDFDTEVSNNTSVAANTTHISSDGSDHSKVGANETAIGLNTTHKTSDGSDHTFLNQDVTTTGTPTFGVTTLGDSSQLATSAAPTVDADIANKKYVDDNSGGTVDISGTPVLNDFARFTDANTIEGRSYTETKSDLSLDNVTNVATDDTAYNATSWNANTDSATKNAIRDKVETMDTAIGLNTSKVTNVSTNLSEGTSTETTVDVDSSDGTNATLVAATTIRAGLLTKAKFDEIVVNNAKNTNVSTTLSIGTRAATTMAITSDGGADDVILLASNTTQAGLMTDAQFDKLDAIEASADVTDTANVTSAGALMDSEVDADIKTLLLPASTTISTFGASLVDDIASSNARTTLDVDQAGTDNSTDVSLAGTPNYITLSGQIITRNQVDLAADVTGNLPVTNQNSGTGASSATFWRGDGAWATPAGSGDVSKVGTPANSQVGVWTGDGTIEGAATLTYDGSNFQLTGDIGATGARITKGWFVDLQVTNAIAGSITGNAATVTTITGLAPDTATTQATQASITTASNLTTVGTISSGTWSATDIAAAAGGTGRSSHTAYAILAGGTTTTAAQQSVSGVGTADQVLTSNGAAALPTWQDSSGGASVLEVQVFS